LPGFSTAERPDRVRSPLDRERLTHGCQAPQRRRRVRRRVTEGATGSRRTESDMSRAQRYSSAVGADVRGIRGFTRNRGRRPSCPGTPQPTPAGKAVAGSTQFSCGEPPKESAQSA
jgi:hypothetical protein